MRRIRAEIVLLYNVSHELQILWYGRKLWSEWKNQVWKISTMHRVWYEIIPSIPLLPGPFTPKMVKKLVQNYVTNQNLMVTYLANAI